MRCNRSLPTSLNVVDNQLTVRKRTNTMRKLDMLTRDKLMFDGIRPNENGNQLILLSLMGLIPECF